MVVHSGVDHDPAVHTEFEQRASVFDKPHAVPEVTELPEQFVTVAPSGVGISAALQGLSVQTGEAGDQEPSLHVWAPHVLVDVSRMHT